MLILDTRDRRPIYEQLKSKITELVLKEVYPPGMQLPSVRSLARELGVNPNTVQKAYQELEREQVIYTISGKGSFISANPQAKERRRQEVLEQLKGSVQECCKAGVTPEEIWKAVTDGINQMGEEGKK